MLDLKAKSKAGSGNAFGWDATKRILLLTLIQFALLLRLYCCIQLDSHMAAATGGSSEAIPGAKPGTRRRRHDTDAVEPSKSASRCQFVRRTPLWVPCGCGCAAVGYGYGCHKVKPYD